MSRQAGVSGPKSEPKRHRPNRSYIGAGAHENVFFSNVSFSAGSAGNLPGYTVGLRCSLSGVPLGYGDLAKRFKFAVPHRGASVILNRDVEVDRFLPWGKVPFPYPSRSLRRTIDRSRPCSVGPFFRTFCRVFFRLECRPHFFTFLERFGLQKGSQNRPKTGISRSHVCEHFFLRFPGVFSVFLLRSGTQKPAKTL